MPELLLELFSEEIPARMQARAAEDLARLVTEALASLAPRAVQTFYGPRRIALAATVDATVPATATVERGPRTSAPEQALTGFLRKHAATLDMLVQEGGYWVLHKAAEAQGADMLAAAALPGLLRRFPWPKSMRWGGSGSVFTWVRPLRRILCLLDGEVVPFDLRDGADDGHGLVSGDQTEGHRFFDNRGFAVRSLAEWQDGLGARRVVVDAGERRRLIADGVTALAAQHGLTVVDDPALLDEVVGLVEWPVPLLGRIDGAYMDLPPEVMQVSMRVNQRYFALRQADGGAAPFFAFAANIEATDGGATIIAGNERVLRARFSDARHFWDLDRRTKLADRVKALDAVTFHAKLGTQGERVHRVMQLAEAIAPVVGADPALAARAAWLAKADLTTGMVGEFPELQGVMGRYYALHDGENPAVADAVRDHYGPRGPGDAVPRAPVTIAVALAEKLDLLAAFFGIGEKPTGSGDPFALRRAALGIIRIIRDNGLRIRLRDLIEQAGHGLRATAPPGEILAFLAERLRVQLRAEGARHDVLDAVFAARADDDLVRLLSLAGQIDALLATEDGASLLVAYRRAANILRIETAKDGPYDGPSEPSLWRLDEEAELGRQLALVAPEVESRLQAEDFTAAMRALATLRQPLDAFFTRVTVNDPEPTLRRNRLNLLQGVRVTMDRVADFSRIEG
ncbi:MAG: glycine--tRNA ligase subunit beta [Acetobacteraceae bacterium]